MKTPTAVLTDLYKAVKAEFPTVAVYKQQRPTNSVAEDCVVRVISGGLQKHTSLCMLTVMMFTPDIETANTVQMDTAKATTKEASLLAFSDKLPAVLQGYTVLLDSREIYTYPAEGLNQHYSILKINVKH